MAWSGSCVPRFVNTWFCNSGDHSRHCACTWCCTAWSWTTFVLETYKPHLRNPPLPLHPPSENKHTSAVPMAPRVFFQPPCSCLTYPGFSKQCEPCKTPRKVLIPQWFSVPSFGGPRFVRTFHYDPSILGGPAWHSSNFIELCQPLYHKAVILKGADSVIDSQISVSCRWISIFPVLDVDLG